MSNSYKASLTEGNVSGQLLRLSLPMIFGLISISLINIVDTFFISFLGKKELAAISFTFPVISLMNSIYLGLGTGGASVIARAIGRGSKSEVQRLTTDSLLLALIVVAFFMVLGLLSIDFVFNLLGAEPEIISLIREYMDIWYWGMLFLVFPIIGNNALRASGNTIFPSLIMFIAFVVNTILDPILIFGLLGFPRLEMQGAAIASVIARVITLFASLYFLHVKENMLCLNLPKIKSVLNSWKSILHVGLPAVGSNMVNPFIISIITALIAAYGVDAIAAVGIATKIEMFIIMVLAALSSVVMPMVGQNWGSQNYKRVDKIVSTSFNFCILWGLISTISLILFGNEIVKLFNADTNILNITNVYFWVVPISYASIGIVMCSIASFNAMGMPKRAVTVTLTRALLIVLPLTVIGQKLLGLTGIFLGISVGNIVSGIIFYYWNKNSCLHPECKISSKQDIAN